MPSDHFLRVGGITIAIQVTDPSVTWTWPEATARFLVPPEPADVELSVHAKSPPDEHGELLFESGAIWRLLRSEHGYRVECRSPLFGPEPYRVACFDSTFTRGDIYVLPGTAAVKVNPLEYPLDEVLMANLLGRGRGVELHSCGVIDHQGKGHLFVGASGAGKSTMAGLWGKDLAGVVSDDRVILREIDGAIWMYGTPWHGEAALSIATSVPLVKIYLLVQAGENAIQALSIAEAVARLFSCTFPPFYDDAAVSFTLSFLERLATLVPVRELRFTRDRAAVELLFREA